MLHQTFKIILVNWSMKLYKHFYRSFVIEVTNCASSASTPPFHYRAEAYNPVTDKRFQTTGTSDTEALHKLRGRIDRACGKRHISGN